MMSMIFKCCWWWWRAKISIKTWSSIMMKKWDQSKKWNVDEINQMIISIRIKIDVRWDEMNYLDFYMFICYIWLDFFWRLWNFAIKCLAFSQFFSDSQVLCFDLQSFYLIKYCFRVIFSYFRIRFFKIRSILYDFFADVSLFILTSSELIKRDLSNEFASSLADFNCVIDITRWIRAFWDNINS